MTWQDDKRRVDKFMPEICEILGRHLIVESPIEEDQQRNTDLLVLKLDSVRIACRVRSPKFKRFLCDFTIRSERPSGNKTEMAKIIEGWGDYFFYGHETDDRLSLAAWGLGDLKAFRLWCARTMHVERNGFPGKLIHNYDGSSSFRAFKWSAIGEEFLIASKGLPCSPSSSTPKFFTAKPV
jgi:hypothetical protein